MIQMQIYGQKMLIIKLNKKGKKKVNKKLKKFQRNKILNKYRILYKTINE